MKRLTITYGDMTIHDGDVDEFSWVDSPNGVTVAASIKPKPASTFLSALTKASRQRAAATESGDDD